MKIRSLFFDQVQSGRSVTNLDKQSYRTFTTITGDAKKNTVKETRTYDHLDRANISPGHVPTETYRDNKGRRRMVDYTFPPPRPSIATRSGCSE